MAADRSLSLTSVNRTIPHIAGRNLSSRPHIRTVKPSRHEHARRAATSAELQTHYDRAKANSVKLTSLAAKSANVQDDDLNFQQDFTSQLSEFSTNMLGFQTALAQTASDKGLANYDDKNGLETLLKDIVNANKDALTAVDVAVYNLPLLGPILGPIVYDIKCLIDGILDAIEDFTDATLNALKPLLQALLRR